MNDKNSKHASHDPYAAEREKLNREYSDRRRRENRRKILAICAAAVLVIALAALFIIDSAAERRAVASGETPGVTEADLARQGGAVSGKTAVLLIGVDKFQNEMKNVGFMNNQQSDFVTLLIFDHDEESFVAIHFNRDTICDVTRYGLGGKRADTVPMQLALSHTYGDGGKLSCRNTVASVNSLLPDVRIKNYACVTMEAVIELTDLCGGIPVFMDDDYTVVDPEFQKGLTLTLDGETALTFIRMRRSLADSANSRRMERQKNYMNSLAETLIKQASADPGFGLKAIDVIEPYLTTDADDYTLIEFMSWLLSYQFKGLVSPEGSFADEGRYVEFHPYPASLNDLEKTYWK